MAVLRFIANLGKNKLIPYESVERNGKNGEKITRTYDHWANLIAENFEKLGSIQKHPKTSDPDDYEYRRFYDNRNDSDDSHISHGANYHQEPEWLWPIGFYLRARLIFAKKTNRVKETVAEAWKHLSEIQTSPWRGLPELTNENGSYCIDSCRTQFEEVTPFVFKI